MDSAASHRWLTRAQIALALVLLVGASAALLRSALSDPDVPFLVPSRDAPWIADPMPLHTQGMWIDKASPRPRVFERRFQVADPRAPVTLRVRALRDLTLTLNGRIVDLAARDSRRWRVPSVVDVTPLLTRGENVLRAEVRSPLGAALLQARLDGLPEPIVTDARWLAARGDDPLQPALLADDGRRHPDALLLPAPGPALRAHGVAFLALFALGCALFLSLRARPALAARAPATALALVTAFWLWLFVAKIVRIPASSGFDAVGHVEVVRFILARGALPLASDGIAAYHPPLYHLLAAAALGLAKPTPGGVTERALLSLAPALSGLGMAFVARALARRLAPGAPWIAAGTALAAGLLPMSLTLGASVSNEGLHALLASLAVLAALRMSCAERVRLRDDVLLGALIGAGLLTKYTSLLLLPLLVGVVAAKRVVAEGAPVARALGGASASIAVAAGLAGWVYLRNWLHFGDPLVWNMDADPARTWWQLPGFHTPGYFLRFGDALTRPWLSAFHGFWDSVYTTLWGDGLLGGASAVANAHGLWRYDFMAAVFLLALPATALLGVGWLRAAASALRDGALGRRIAFSLVALLPPLLLVSLVSVNLRMPFWSLGKAFYALFLTPILGLLGVLGFESLDRALAARAPALRPLPFGFAAAFLGGIALAYGA